MGSSQQVFAFSGNEEFIPHGRVPESSLAARDERQTVRDEVREKT